MLIRTVWSLGFSPVGAITLLTKQALDSKGLSRAALAKFSDDKIVGRVARVMAFYDKLSFHQRVQPPISCLKQITGMKSNQVLQTLTMGNKGKVSKCRCAILFQL